MKVLQFIASILGAVALMPAGAHLFALPNKIHMNQHDYFVAQSAYNGWALFGIALFGNLIVLVALTVVQRAQRIPFVLVLISLACQILTLALFLIVVFPANQATANWTQVVANWDQIRWQWEIGHAVNAAIIFGGYCAVMASILLTRD